ncbi:MAG: glycosyltransferase [Caulobacteraceae bacterium]
MSLIQKARSVRRRLAGAIHRHGVVHVATVVGLTILRQGMFNAFRMAGSGRPFSQKPSKRSLRAPAPPPALEPDLDAAYTLSGAEWRTWAPLLAAAADPEDDRFAPADLDVVIRGAEAAPDATEATRTAVQAMGPSARLWSARSPAHPDRFVLFLKAGDLPSPGLPKAIAAAARGGICQAVSFDLVRRTGDRVQPLLLPGANPTLLAGADYVFSRIALRGAALGEDRDLEAANPRERLLAWLKTQPPLQARGRWRHVGRTLVEAAVSDADMEAQRQAALAHGRRPVARGAAEGATVVICTKDKGHLTRQLVRQLLAKDRTAVEEVVIVSNNTANPYALQTLTDLSAEPRVRVLKKDEPFNFSRLCNAGVRAGQGRGPVLLLNDDIDPVSEDWIERLLWRLEDPAVGAVGPLLLYPDERVQHTGMYLGHAGIAGHILRAARLPETDYLLTGCAAREVSAVTGAVLMTSRAAFEALNGLDEQLATYLQDVDYCLRVRGAGLINVFEPASVLIHMESASIRSLETPAFHHRRYAERLRFVERWGDLLLNDPLHPRGFDLDDETLRRLRGPGGKRPGALG